MNNWIKYYILSMQMLTANLNGRSISPTFDNTFAPFNEVEQTAQLYTSLPERFSDDDVGKTLKSEYVRKNLNPFINIATLHQQTKTYGNTYKALALIKQSSGTYAIYKITGQDDINYMLADLSSGENYPRTLQLFQSREGITYNWFIYHPEINIIEINYLEHDYAADDSCYVCYIQTVERYLLEPSFPRLSDNETYIVKFKIDSLPRGNAPIVPEIHKETYIIDSISSESIDLDDIKNASTAISD